jgi:hypothetical protein
VLAQGQASAELAAVESQKLSGRGDLDGKEQRQ